MADQSTEGLLSPYLMNQRIIAVRPHLNGNIMDVGCGTGRLADEVPAERYLGIEIDPYSLGCARREYPDHFFLDTLPVKTGKYDTVVSLAVIEHVHNPSEFLEKLSEQLAPGKTSRIILTTPHPSMEWIHRLGSLVGLFSKHANDEHEELLDKEMLEFIGFKAGLKLIRYHRFLYGCNQIAIFEK